MYGIHRRNLQKALSTESLINELHRPNPSPLAQTLRPTWQIPFAESTSHLGDHRRWKANEMPTYVPIHGTRKATILRQSYTCWESSTEVPETLYKLSLTHLPAKNHELLRQLHPQIAFLVRGRFPRKYSYVRQQPTHLHTQP